MLHEIWHQEPLNLMDLIYKTMCRETRDILSLGWFPELQLVKLENTSKFGTEIFYRLVNKKTGDCWNIHLRVVLECPQSGRPPKTGCYEFSFTLTLTEGTSEILDKAYHPAPSIG